MFCVTIRFPHAHLHRFIYYRGHTLRQTVDQISLIVACQVGGVRGEFMANQMVTFLSSMALPEPAQILMVESMTQVIGLDGNGRIIIPKPGQIFMVGSMTWVIGPDGNTMIIEVVQYHPTPIAPTPAMTSPIPVPRRQVRRSISSDDLIASIDQVTYRLAECQLLVDSVLD